MHKDKRVVAIIPARGGSKGVPRKNIRLLRGAPIIAWTIDAAKQCPYIDKCLVSTDDIEIADISVRHGADVPFLRPSEIARDDSKTIDVIVHALDWLAKSGERYDIVILLQPTSPLRTGEDISGAIDMLLAKNAQAIVSVCHAEHNPYWANTLPPDGSMADFLKPGVMGKNRQDLPYFFRLNGAVYVGYSAYVRAHNGFFGEKTFAYIMPKERSIDIDDELDLKIAERMFTRNKNTL